MKYINPISPTATVCLPCGISLTRGDVSGAENLLTRDESAAKLRYIQGGKAPAVILDMGPASPGGYPVFTVKSAKGNPVLRASYADWYDYIVDETHGKNGDFLRGTCKYLGVELPVLPGNPNRFEQYTITRTGTYLYPLIQGQQRFVMLTLETPGTSVELSSFYIRYTSDMTPLAGCFGSGCAPLSHLWNASAYTVQLATITGSDAWDTAENRLLLRTLTKGSDCGYLPKGRNWKNYEFSFTFEISRNPQCTSGIGWIVRTEDGKDGYVFRLNLDGYFQKYIRKNGTNHELSPRNQLPPLTDNKLYHITTRVLGDIITVYLNGEKIGSLQDSTYPNGSIGFSQTTEKWAVVHALTVMNGTEILWQDDFSNGLEDYAFTRSDAFISDGAKRDRLPWLGDLYWAGRNAYYAYGDTSAMEKTLEMFARHQTPEGFIWGVCYPENESAVTTGDYGYYESDIFSAWFVPVLYDLILFTGVSPAAEKFYPVMRADLNYLWEYVESDGLFYQRYGTSKGLWDHNLDATGKLSYTNILIADAMLKGAYIAKIMGKYSESKTFLRRYELMRKGIMSILWNSEKGYFRESLETAKPCYMSAALALAMGFLPPSDARNAIKYCLKAHETEFIMGKILSLFVEGCFRYGYSDEAYSILTGSTGFVDYLGECTVNWIDAVADPKGPACTGECMTYGKVRIASDVGWSDMSHPDTAVAHIISGYILGVRPDSPGFAKFTFEPAPCGLSNAFGKIPTPFGEISAQWFLKGETLHLELLHPIGTEPNVVAPDGAVVNISQYGTEDFAQALA